MGDLSRRTLGKAAGAGAAIAYLGGLSTSSVAAARIDRHAGTHANSIAGTTLESVAAPGAVTTPTYRRLTAGPGWPLVVRSELAPARAGRQTRRTGVASLVQTTDIHIVDSESPVRAEFAHTLIGAAFRPHETLGSRGTIELINRINALATAPFSGRAFDCVVSTGDNTDNHEHVEADWFLTLFSGGTLAQSTGDLKRYEGVQAWGSDLYWQPESTQRDSYKRKGFPHVPGLLSAAIAPVTSPGLHTRWYSVFGNHDDSVEGTVPSGVAPLDALYTGSVKPDVPQSSQRINEIASLLSARPGASGTVFAQHLSHGPIRHITPDKRRAPFTPRQYMAKHWQPEFTGAGPAGHGFARDAAQSGITYYSFEIAPSIIGIAMDTTNHAGFTDGSIGETQLRWMEKLIASHSRRYVDGSGRIVTRPSADDTMFVVFSHHTSDTMELPIPDPENPHEKRYTGKQLVDFFHRFPHVLAWVNGHTHENKITPHRGLTAAESFWEINTASHIDFPQLARIIEVCDNNDGTLSLFCTLIESAAPYAASYSDFSISGLASMYREFSYNDPGFEAKRSGAAGDHNVELLLTRP